jgi:uncharacterized membrane protein YccF (DUF307 family)
MSDTIGLDPRNLASFLLGLAVFIVILIGVFQAVGHFASTRISKIVGTVGVMVALSALCYMALDFFPTIGKGVADKAVTTDVDLPTFENK